MASTIKIQDVVRSMRSWSGLTPVQSQSGWSSEPALSCANWVLQFILAPPFAWRWNRGVEVTFTTTAGVQNYTVTSGATPPTGFQNSPLNWLEQCTLTSGSTFAKQLEISTWLGTSVIENEPTHIAAVYDDGAGSYSFRLTPVPDNTYTAHLAYQVAPDNITSLSSTWDPIPDYMYYIYQQGFLAKLLEQANDQRYVSAMESFFRMVISANDGISDSQKNLLLKEKLITLHEQQSVMQNK